MLRSLVAIVLVLLIGAGAAGAYWKFVAEPAVQGSASGSIGGRGGARGPVVVEAEPVTIAPVEVTTEAVGSLISNEAVMMKPEVTGRIAAINFAEGRPVRAGQVMVELDASVERAQLAEAEAQLQLATANLERARELRRSVAGTQRALDEAQAQQRTAQAAVDLAKARLAKLSLVAPFDGVAGLRLVSVGDFVTAGTAIVNVEQIQPLKVDFRIPEIFLPSLIGEESDNRIAVTVDALPGETFPGRIYAINPLVDEQGRAIVVRARIDNPVDPATGEPRLRPGLFVRVQLTLSEEPRGLWVPEQALVPQEGKQFVYTVVPGDGAQRTVRMTEVTVGRRRQGEAQLETGVGEGDIVVVAGVAKLRDGAEVRLAEPRQEPGDSPPDPATVSDALPAVQG